MQSGPPQYIICSAASDLWFHFFTAETVSFTECQERILNALKKNDRPLQKKLMRLSLRGRRMVINKLEDGAVGEIVEQFPLLKDPEFVCLVPLLSDLYVVVLI